MNALLELGGVVFVGAFLANAAFRATVEKFFTTVKTDAVNDVKSVVSTVETDAKKL